MIWKRLLFINKERPVCLYFFTVTNTCGILKGSLSKIGFFKILRETQEKLQVLTLSLETRKFITLQNQDDVTSLWAKAIE